MARRRLKTATDLRRYLADLINRVEQKEIEPEAASKLGFLTNILLRVIEGSDIEKRLKELEVKYEETKEQTGSTGNKRAVNYL